jgi:hypothetical protein
MKRGPVKNVLRVAAAAAVAAAIVAVAAVAAGIAAAVESGAAAAAAAVGIADFPSNKSTSAQAEGCVRFFRRICLDSKYTLDPGFF